MGLVLLWPHLTNAHEENIRTGLIRTPEHHGHIRNNLHIKKVHGRFFLVHKQTCTTMYCSGFPV